MKQLISKKFKLPIVYFITDREDIKKLPLGIPYIYGEEKNEELYVRILEYEILFQSALRTGLPFNFRQILIDNGYDVTVYGHCEAILAFIDSTELGEMTTEEISALESHLTVSQYIKDTSYYVDINVLKNLNVFPKWVDNIEESIKENIVNFLTINPLGYNKKLDGMYGNISFTPPSRNLIIIDISGSIPRSCSSTTLSLAKHLGETFYADILITGAISTLYEYENIHTLNIDTIYDVNGMNNDQVYFKKLLTESEKHYKTVIVFGDDHYPGERWNGKGTITEKDGKAMCKWTVDHLISLHVKNTKNLAGYSRWFSPKTEDRIANWTKYLI